MAHVFHTLDIDQLSDSDEQKTEPDHKIQQDEAEGLSVETLTLQPTDQESSKAKSDSESSSPSSPVYSFKDVTKDENGHLETEVIRYGEIQHSTILDIFGHLMFYDKLEFYTRDQCASTYFTAKFKYSEDECYLSVFSNTNRTDHYDDLFFSRAFDRLSMSMEPFITLGQIERDLQAEEDTARSVTESSTESSPESSVTVSKVDANLLVEK